ncbi:His Kinase A (phospho-acceptor) domain-containing protein [Aerococcus urinaehominis]|uniref:sensor histidine kinase n=1 Tax=Aerococcus urinaehominis TaxID=128944 RepID=UPI000888F526|nr:HAMP domain-containing sensor histidine kinase [Aerococcus urinaehominis]SDM58048.1 His Kinase A (phospho-acceptor) domain-containing protein [Aerococcus urinaehominis]
MSRKNKKKSRIDLELFLEAMGTLSGLVIIYFGLMFVAISVYDVYLPYLLVNYPDIGVFFLSNQDYFFVGASVIYIILSLAMVVNRILKRRQAIQLTYILDELHYIAQGHYDHRISTQHSADMRPIVESINRLVESTTRAMAEERRVEQTKDELITNMSHDIRTPLTSIIGYLGLLNEGQYKSQAELEKYVSIAFKKSLQLQHMVEDLFEYTKVRQVNLKLDIQTVVVPRLMDQIAVEFEMEAQAVGRQIIVDYQPDSFSIEIDSEKLARVFNNLVTNAIKYGRDGHYIRLWARQNNQETQFMVENDGLIIPGDQLENIFQRFYRGNIARSPGTEGSGLGLAIAQSIVELHHGQISVASDAQSTRFIFKIPNHYAFKDEEECHD